METVITRCLLRNVDVMLCEILIAEYVKKDSVT